MNFYHFLVQLHSVFRWILLLLLISAIVIGILHWIKKTGLGLIDKKVAKITMIFMHTQVLLGIILYFISPKVVFSEYTMSSSILRFYTMEHISIMILATAIITIGYSKTKKIIDPYKAAINLTIWYGIGLLLILSAIPWPFRNLGANWL